MTLPKLYHGGIPGKMPGDVLLPSSPHYVDGCAICEAKKAGVNTKFDPLTARPDRIYATSDVEYARFYASKYPFGDLYVVALVPHFDGEVERSEEDLFPSWCAPSALVVEVLARRVRLTRAQRRALLHRWPGEGTYAEIAAAGREAVLGSKRRPTMDTREG